MNDYYIKQICLNGHIITSRYEETPEARREYCSECGEPTIHECKECGESIKGGAKSKDPGLAVTLPGEDGPANFCDACGEPYPWTAREIEAAEELIDHSDVEENLKEDYRDAIPDLINENPKTKPAALKIVDFLEQTGTKIKEEARDLFVDISSKTAAEVLKSEM